MNELFAAIDIGGTKIAIEVGRSSGEIVDSVRIATEPESGPDRIIENIGSESGLIGTLAVATPGNQRTRLNYAEND